MSRAQRTVAIRGRAINPSQQDFVAIPPGASCSSSSSSVVPRQSRTGARPPSSSSNRSTPHFTGDTSSSTPVGRETLAPLESGHIQISNRWTGSTLVQDLQAPASPFVQVHLGIFPTFDFRPSSGILVLLLTEADYVGSDGQAFKRKVAKFYSQRGACQAVVICQRSELTSLDFLTVQEFVVIHLGLALIPIGHQKDLPQVLQQLSGVQRKPNPFLLGRQRTQGSKSSAGVSVTVHKELLITLATIPGLGEKRARALLSHFRTLLAICEASLTDLAQVVGQSQASAVYNFIHTKRRVS